MFVSRLDRPWARTPFALQGFYIRDLEEIHQLQKYCRYVYVDVHKTVGSAGATLRRLLGGSCGRQDRAASRVLSPVALWLLRTGPTHRRNRPGARPAVRENCTGKFCRVWGK